MHSLSHTEGCQGGFKLGSMHAWEPGTCHLAAACVHICATACCCDLQNRHAQALLTCATCARYRSCISRSPNAPADCEGDDCNVYIEE